MLALAACLAFIVGCDIGVNPLLFDGAPVDVTFDVNTTGNAYSGLTTVDLSEVFEKIGNEIDSVKIFNITVQVETTEVTPGTTILNGFASAGGNTIITLHDLPLSSVKTERSIFDTTITGFELNTAGVQSLVDAIRAASEDRGNSHPIDFAVAGTASNSPGSPLQMKVHFKVYTQVFTEPK